MNFENTFLCVSLDVIYLSFGNGIVEVWKKNLLADVLRIICTSVLLVGYLTATAECYL